MQKMRTIAWTEDFKFPSSKYDIQEIDVESWNAWVYEQLPWLKNFSVIGAEDLKTFSKALCVGEKHKFIVKEYSEIEKYNRWAEMCSLVPSQLLPKGGDATRRREFVIINSSRTKSAVIFDGKPIVPVLFKNKRFDGWTPIMSLTPMEAMTMRAVICKAKGKVLLGGLGIGYLARRILQRKQVKSVLVVEKCAEIIETFGKFLFEEFGDRVKIIQGDMYTHPWSDFDAALWDIWDGIGDAGWDSKYRDIRKEMRDAGKTCVGWTDWEPERDRW